MFSYVLVADTKDNFKLFNNTHVFGIKYFLKNPSPSLVFDWKTQTLSNSFKLAIFDNWIVICTFWNGELGAVSGYMRKNHHNDIDYKTKHNKSKDNYTQQF